LCQPGREIDDGTTLSRGSDHPAMAAPVVTLRDSGPADAAAVVDIWRRAVDATHDFLLPEDRQAIEAEVAVFLPQAPLRLAIDDTGRPVGFMLLDGNHMEALFIDPDARGKGVGRALVEDALAQQAGLTTDVNEQNRQAIGFYERMGFVRTGRSPTDGQGRPYPLIHLSWQAAGRG
jgi:putative acetyltransferase